MVVHILMERTIIKSSIRWNVFPVATSIGRMEQTYGKENVPSARAESRRVLVPKMIFCSANQNLVCHKQRKGDCGLNSRKQGT